jgi:hypothetical protein
LGVREGEEVGLRVRLVREEALENEMVVSGSYPGEKEEFWWVIVGDKKSNRVLTTKRTLVP